MFDRTVVMSATLDSMIVLATRLAYALDPAEFAERTIEQAAAVVCAEPAQQHRRHDPSCLDRQHDLDHVPRMRGDQVPIGVTGEQRVDMRVADRLGRAIEGDVAQTAHAWHQLDAEQSAQAEHGLALPLVSACSVSGWMSERFFSNPSKMWAASQTPHGMKLVNRAM